MSDFMIRLKIIYSRVELYWLILDLIILKFLRFVFTRFDPQGLSMKYLFLIILIAIWINARPAVITSITRATVFKNDEERIGFTKPLL